ncbi:copper-binding protein [Ramlibacter sp. AN1015]|uniref:copper-binding protein n=1 Tax=Ramlibacter sp. AN1015 TaxID=3133428 RepID=UPI0030BCD49E
MKRYLITAALVLGANSVWAQQSATQAADDHSAHHPTTTAAPAPATDLAEGEVRKVDKAAGKITLRHGQIKSLDMPPMTMVFVVADAAMLDQVKPGDKVRFRAADQGGKLTVTQIEAAN